LTVTIFNFHSPDWNWIKISAGVFHLNPVEEPVMIKKSTYLPSMDMMALQIDRISVERCETEPALDILETLLEAQNCNRFKNRLLICVGGYDDDPRELCEIAKVRTYIAQLDEQWPYWFYFLNPETTSLRFLIFTLCQFTKTGDGGIYLAPVDLKTFIFKHFHAVNLLVERGLVTDEENYDVSQKIEKYIVSM